MLVHLEDLILSTLNSKVPLYHQKILAHELTLKRPFHELEKQVSERKEQSEMLMQSVLREAFAKG
jgi:hypothetical protein